MSCKRLEDEDLADKCETVENDILQNCLNSQQQHRNELVVLEGQMTFSEYNVEICSNMLFACRDYTSFPPLRLILLSVAFFRGSSFFVVLWNSNELE